MDDVLADLNGWWWDRCIEAGVVFDVADRSLQTHRFGSDHIPDPVHRRLARSFLEVGHAFAEFPVIEGAQEGVTDLLDRGHDLWVCSKPLEVNHHCMDDKATWLRRYFPWLATRLILAPDKTMVHGDVLLDDAPPPFTFPQYPWAPVVFTRAFNGEGSTWGHLPHWSWGEPYHVLEEA